MSPSPDPKAFAALNELLAVLEDDPDLREGLMREHLEAARTYLSNGMPEEYQIVLKLAAGALADVPDGRLRDRISEFLQTQRQVR